MLAFLFKPRESLQPPSPLAPPARTFGSPALRRRWALPWGAWGVGFAGLFWNDGGSSLPQILQYDMWNVTPTDLWDWSALKAKIAQ